MFLILGYNEENINQVYFFHLVPNRPTESITIKGCTHRATEALRLYISMHLKGLSICGYTYPLRSLLFRSKRTTEIT